jgi:hypothetical protein
MACHEHGVWTMIFEIQMTFGSFLKASLCSLLRSALVLYNGQNDLKQSKVL